MQIDFIFTITIFIFSVIIHEVAHGLAAYAQGDNTAKMAGRLTLNPIPHIDLFGSIILPLLLVFSGSPMVIGWAKPVPFNPYNLTKRIWGLPAQAGEAIVAFAGPLSNIAIAIVFGSLIKLGLFTSLTGPFLYIVLINLVLATFNLVPIPPLDGSKILFTLFPNSLTGLRNFMEQYGFMVLIFFVIFLWDRLFPIIEWQFRFLTGLTF